MNMYQLSGYWHTEHYNHQVKVRKLKTSVRDEGHIKVRYDQKCFRQTRLTKEGIF